MDAKMASWKSTGTYVDEVPPPGANIVSGMWIFRVKRPPGSPPVFKARYVARGFSQREGVEFFQTFSPTPKMTTLRVLLHVAAHRDYELHSLDFSTAFLQGNLHEEILLRRPRGFTGSFPGGTQWSLRRPVYGLRQAPREWHDTLRTTLAALGYAPSTADPSLFLRTDTTLPSFYILVYVDDLVFATADAEALAHVKSELQKRHTCTDLGPSALRLHVLLAIVHSSAYQSLALSSTFGRVRRAEWPTGGAAFGGAETGRAEPGGVAPEGTVSGGAEPARAESGGALGVPSRREPLSPQRLREWYSRRCRVAAGAGAGTTRATGGAAVAGVARGAGAAGGATGAGAAGGAAGAGAAGGAAGAGAAGGAASAGAAGGAAGAGGAGGAGGATRATGGGAGAGAAGRAAGTGDPGAEGTGSVSVVSGGTARPRPYYVPLLQQVLGSPPSPRPPPPFLSPPPVQSQSQLQPASPLPRPSPYSGPTRGLTERREPVSPVLPVLPASRSASPVRAVHVGRVSRPRPPPVPGTHSMTLRSSTAPQRVPLPSPPASSLPDGPDPGSDSLRAASPTVTRFLATAVTDPLFESTAASALVTELVDFAAACRLDYATSLVAESASASVCPPSVGGECALGTDVLEDRQEEFDCFAASVPHLVSMLLAPEGDPDAPDIPTPRSYAEAIEGPYSSQWQAAMDAEMASWKSTSTYVDEVPPPGANIVSGMWIFRVKRPPGSPPAFKARYVARGFSQRQRLDFFQTFSPTPKMATLRVLQRFGFTYSSPQSTPLPTSHSLSAPPSDESVEPSGPYPELVGCLITSGMGLVLGGRARVVLTGHADASWVDDLATQRSSQGYTFSLGSGSISWRSTRSSSVLSFSCEAEIYAGAMAAQELRWLTYLLTDLGEAPRSPPVVYVENKAMLALCLEHRLEHRTKHIALCYLLARELQQRGQLRLAYLASQANTADVFTKALQPCDHQRFCTVLGLVPTVPHLLSS
ncbi:unnamed protein product [Closterium sp. NIES-54]